MVLGAAVWTRAAFLEPAVDAVLLAFAVHNSCFMSTRLVECS